MQRVEGKFIGHTACERCGSSDAKALYDSGTGWCFSCQTFFPNVDSNDSTLSTRVSKNFSDFLVGVPKELVKRGITQKTCEKFGYVVGKYKGEPCHIAPYYDVNGEFVAQHIRTKSKQFPWIGNAKAKLQLFGQRLWRDGGKRVVVTEGELDCLSVSQAFNNKWQVVSVPNGAASASKYVKYNFEWLDKFDEIVFAFDNDEAGQKAAKECAILFKAGKVKIANWSPYKDANDYLQAGEGEAIAPIIFSAKLFRPDGIITGDELSLESLMTEEEIFSYDTPYPKLNRVLKGIRKGEITMCTAGSGIGKSTLVKEIAYHLMTDHNLSVGVVALEESVKKTALSMMAIDMNVPLAELFLNRNIVEREQFEKSYHKMVANKKLYLYDHFGSLESDNLMGKMRYLASACDVDFIILDHISIVVSGIEDGEERRIIDNLMTQLRSLVENTGVGMIVITHLKVPEGKPHEEGGRVTLSQLRGSGALKQLSDTIIALERDQQGENPNESLIRVLKNRLIGTVGLADALLYNSETGRLLAYDVPEFEAQTEGDTF